MKKIIDKLVDTWVDFAMSESFIFYVGGFLVLFSVIFCLITRATLS
jgi:hypothetical protein